MANNYCTIANIREAMPDSGVDVDDSYDALITALITRASRLIDDLKKRKPGAFYWPSSDEETRYFRGDGTDVISIGEFVAAPSYVGRSEAGGLASSDYTEAASTDYFVAPENAALDGMPYTQLVLDSLNGAYTYWPTYRKAVKVTAAFGFSTTVPDVIRQACIIQTVRWFKRAHQAYQDTGAIIELGQLRYVKQLDPDVQLILDLPQFNRVTV